jgi:DNA primase
MTFADRVKFCKSLHIVQVCSDIGGVEFVGNCRSAMSPFRSNSNKNSFSVDERHNVFTDWGYPVSDNARGVASGDPIDFVRYKFGYSFKEAVDYLYEWYNGNANKVATTKTVVVQKQTRHEADDLTPEQIDNAYKIFLALSTLDDRAKEALRERNLSNDEITDYSFRTFPKRVIKGDLNRRLREANIKPESVPGLYLRNGDKDASFKFYDALVIPVKTVDNLIAGLQLRFFTKGDGPRYIWFSSSNFTAPEYAYDGKTPGTPLGFVDRVKRNETTLFITEGMFKAIAINKCYGCPVISVQGVGNFAGIEETLKKVIQKYPNLTRVLIAYDADFIGNINVTSHAVRLYQTMLANFSQLNYQYVMWDEKYGKGFDDLIQITGGWNVKSIIQTVDMNAFSAAFEEFRPTGVKLLQEGRKDEIAKSFKRILSK